MPEIIPWPCDVSRVHAEYFLRWTSRSAGVSLTGVDQSISSGTAVWEVSVTFPRHFKQDDVKWFEANVALMRGRTNIADLCICDPYAYDSGIAASRVTFVGGTTFVGGAGFVSGGSGSSRALALKEAAEAGSTALTVDLVGPPAMPQFRKGDMFSVDGFLYRVMWVVEDRVRIEPPLRRALPAGTALQADPPHFYGRFATDDEGRRLREYLKWGEQVTVRFVEAFDR